MDTHRDVRYSERRRQLLEPGSIETDVDERPECHVSGDAGEGIQNGDWHSQ
jgi:hypothetical protein